MILLSVPIFTGVDKPKKAKGLLEEWIAYLKKHNIPLIVEKNKQNLLQ
jgi:hypothetical protein